MAKKTTIQLPLKIVLTEEGAAALMQQNIKIQRLKMGDKSEEYGVSMEVLTPAFLQQMIMTGYIAK
ncbi:MAG: hypothetical protein LBN92_01670, partial [Treponema sp.]|nr:hypothetical protein [Treponema sp.]